MPEDSLLTRFLAEREASCPRCGYALRGLSGDRCPECGDALILTVGLVEPRLAWFIAGLIGLGGGLGFSAIVLLYFVASSLSRLTRVASLVELMPLLLGSLVLGAGLAAWIRLRRRIAVLPAEARWLQAIATYIASAAFATWFFLWVA